MNKDSKLLAEAYGQTKLKAIKNKTSVHTEIPAQAFEAVRTGQWSLEDFEEYIKGLEERGMERQETLSWKPESSED